MADITAVITNTKPKENAKRFPIFIFKSPKIITSLDHILVWKIASIQMVREMMQIKIS